MKSIIQLLAGLIIGVLVCYIVFANISKNEQIKSISTHHEVIEKVQAVGKLELVQMNIRDIVEHKIVREWLPNPEAVLIISGEAVGCIDLKKIKPEDIIVSKDSLKIKLPQPELCYCKIDHSKSKVYETKYDYFLPTNLVDSAYSEAERQLRQSALNSGILEQTKTNATVLLKPFFEALGFKNIEIYF